MPPPPPDIFAFSSLPQPCAVAGPAHDAAVKRATTAHDAAVKKPGREELCVFLCDFLFDVTRRDSYHCWDSDFTERRGAAIFRCHLTEPNKYENVNESSKNPVMDVRGLPARQVVDSLQHIVYYRSFESASKPYPCYLKVIVGCQKHGIGEGKVRQEVVSWLEKRNTIEWDENENKSVISIRLDGWKNFEFPDMVVSSDSDYYYSGYDHDMISSLKELQKKSAEEHYEFLRFLKDLEERRERKTEGRVDNVE